MLTCSGRIFPTYYACHQLLAFWNSSPDPLVPADPHNPADQVSSTAIQDLTSTRAGGQDYVSFKNFLK